MFPVENEAFLCEDVKYSFIIDCDFSCSNCGNNDEKEFERDYFHGEIVCKKCGLLIGEIYTYK